MGITVLEMSEAAAVGMTIYASSRQRLAYVAVSAGALVVFIPAALIGKYLNLLPIVYVRLVSATLLLYFGLRLVRSARRSVLFQAGIRGGSKHEELEKGVLSAGFAVGSIEAFEASIVLIALYPNGYTSTLLGLFAGIAVVAAAAVALHSQVRKVKQAIMKIAVSSILLTFSLFWYFEAAFPINDLYLVPMFAVFFAGVYYITHRNIPEPHQTPSEQS